MEITNKIIRKINSQIVSKKEILAVSRVLKTGLLSRPGRYPKH
jgi:hypothetical protein